MDSPEKHQICSSLSEIEDSLVFDYISSLSPINTFKSSSTARDSLSCSSPPSAFESPPASSFKGSRHLRRCQAIPLKAEFCSIGGVEKRSQEVSSVLLSDLPAEELRHLIPRSSTGENPSKLTDECLEFALEFPNTLKDDTFSPNDNMIFQDANETDTVPEKSILASVVELVKVDMKERCLPFPNELELQKAFKLDQEVAECSSPIKEEQLVGQEQDLNTSDPGAISFLSTVLDLPQDDIDDSCDENYKQNSLAPLVCCEQHKMADTAVQSEKPGRLIKTNTEQIFSGESLHEKLSGNSSPDAIDKNRSFAQSSCKQQSIRRHCLVFEMEEKKSICYSSNNFSESFYSDSRHAPHEKNSILIKDENVYSSSKTPGTGLLMNTLATNSKDEKDHSQKILPGKHLISMPCPISSKYSACNKEPPPMHLLEESMEVYKGSVPMDNQIAEDPSQISTAGVAEELNPSSPTRKRHPFDHDNQSFAWKRCNCKRSKCVKLYCDCFAAGLYCIESCFCRDCHNNAVHKNTVLEIRKQIELRNPLAFAPKVIIRTTKDSVAEIGEDSIGTPASAQHKTGCNCRKSGCSKKYCECFQAAVGCSTCCTCEGCKNTYGQKDGDDVEMEAERQEELDAMVLDNLPTMDEENHAAHVLRMTASYKINRPQVKLPHTLGRNPLASQLVAVGSSLTELCAKRKLERSFSDWHQPTLRKCPKTMAEDGTTEVLASSPSAVSVVKSTSPNCKRVSLPEHKKEASQAWKGGKKFILQSVPSFPALILDNAEKHREKLH